MQTKENLNSKLKTLDSKLKISSSKVILSFLILFGGLLSLFSPIPVHAQSTSISFGVDPLTISVDVVANEPVEKQIKIYNLSDADSEYLLSIEKFETIDEKGTLRFEKFKEKPQKEPTITLEKSSVTIPANSSETVNIKFSGPKSVRPKEYYYTVFITPINLTDTVGNNVSFVQGKIGILTYINFVETGEVLGELVKSGAIVEFSTKKLHFSAPVNFTARIDNTGNVHYDAYGTLKIFNSKDQLVDTITIKKATVLPGTIRVLESTEDSQLVWDYGFKAGKFKGVLDVKSADGTLELNEEIEFNTIPAKPILAISGLTLIFSLIILVRRRIAKKH